MGQVAVAVGYRGQRVFDRMYAKLRDVYMDRFDFVVTEVSARNKRSLAAHYRVGFKDLVSSELARCNPQIITALVCMLRQPHTRNQTLLASRDAPAFIKPPNSSPVFPLALDMLHVLYAGSVLRCQGE